MRILLIGVVCVAGCSLINPTAKFVDASADGGEDGQTGDADTSLAITSEVPAPSSDGVTLPGIVEVGFNQDLDPSTIDETVLQLSRVDTSGSATLVPGDVSLVEARRVRFTPSERLDLLQQYTATVGGGLQSVGGARLNDATSWDFTTRDGVWTEPTLVEVINAGRVVAPQIAAGTDGSAHAVWTQSDGVALGIWTTRFDPSRVGA